jgi:hypothetical protein
MARRSLRPQLNQIRAWVQQGRTDAWIAHQLEISTSELREFRREHDLSATEEEAGQVDLRDEIEAEIEAAQERAVTEETAEEEDEEADGGEDEEADGGEDEEADGGEAEGRPPAQNGEEKRGRRRRRGRRGRRRGRKSGPLEATFDHGEKDGYGLWLDPAVKDNPAYAEHWAGHRAVTVAIEADRIVITRADADNGNGDENGD